MVKLFSSLTVNELEKQINKFLSEHPTYEITTISHANVVKRGFFGWFQWNALVVLKMKGSL